MAGTRLGRAWALHLLLVCSALLLSRLDAPLLALRVETLRSIGSLAPHLVGLFEEPSAYQQSTPGTYYVFDRRAHSVYTIDPKRTAARKAVEIGQERGRILLPVGFDVAPDGTFVVADVPGRQRVQIFDVSGALRSGFFIPGQPPALVTIGSITLNGLGSIQHTGNTLLVSQPESGSLFTEYSLAGVPWHSYGRLRETGHEQDRDLHLAMNAGLPLADPTGGYFFVFLAGRPMFRKYDARGTLLFERHIEGVELDAFVASQPVRWPTRKVQDRDIPLVEPVVRAAAVDPRGHLWITLAVPYTYVYDPQGDKVRTVQFSGAGVLNPTSLFFTRDSRLLVTPGCYEFAPYASAATPQARQIPPPLLLDPAGLPRAGR